MFISPGSLLLNRVIESARLDPITEEGFLTRAVAGSTCAICSVVEFFFAIVKDFDDNAVASWGVSVESGDQPTDLGSALLSSRMVGVYRA